MIVPIYAPYFASGENHTVEYAEIKRPFDAFMTVWVKRIDGTICKNEYSLTCRKTVKDFEEYTPDAVISSEWISKLSICRPILRCFCKSIRGDVCACVPMPPKSSSSS